MEMKNEKGIENKVMEQTSGTPDVTTETSGHVPKHEKQSCGEKITNKINGFLENGFANIGYTIASNPIKTIIISLVCLGLCLIGITEYTIENRGEKNWVSQSSDSLKHKDWVEYKFPAKYRQISIMLRNDNGNILTKDGLLDLLSVNERTLNAKTTYEAENGTTLPLTWNSICYSNIGVSGPCIPKSVLEIWRYNKTIIQNLTDQAILDAVNTENLRSPLTGQIMVFDNLIGGPAIKNTDGRIISASVLRINYRLKREEVFDEDKGELVDKAADAFEEEFDKIMANDPSGYTLYSFSEWAANEASEDVSEGDLQFFVIGYLLVIVYLALMLGSFSRINHKVYLAFSGIAVIGIAIGIAYGLGSGFQLKKNAVHDVLPFLLLGIGVDDIFIIVQNWDNVGGPDFSDSRTVPEKMSAAMRHAGVSILVTTVTDVCAFLVGASTILPALRSFCVWAAIGILAVFIYTISFFIALLTLDARRQKQRRDACCCCIKLDDDWKAMECSKKGYLNSFVKNIYGPAILSMPGKIIILLMTAGLLAGGSIGLHNLEQDFDFNWFLPTDSAPRQFTDNEKIFFPGNGQIANAYTGSIDYYSEYKAMELIETSLSSDPYVVSGSVNSWYKSYHIWLNETGRTAGNCSKNIYECRAINESMFYSHLNVFLETEIGKFYSRKIKLPSNGKIEASSIEYQHIIFDTAADEIEGMNSVQEDIKPGTIKTEPDSLLPFAYTPAYIGWETNDVITTELFRNIMLAGLCVLLVTLFLLSNILASIYVLLCVVFSLTEAIPEEKNCEAMGIIIPKPLHIQEKEKAETSSTGKETAFVYGRVETEEKSVFTIWKETGTKVKNPVANFEKKEAVLMPKVQDSIVKDELDNSVGSVSLLRRKDTRFTLCKVLSFQHNEEKSEKRFNDEKQKINNVIEIDETLQNIAAEYFKGRDRVIYTIPEGKEVPVSPEEIAELDDKIQRDAKRGKKKEKLTLDLLRRKIDNISRLASSLKFELSIHETANKKFKEVNKKMKERLPQLEIDIGMQTEFFDNLYMEIVSDIDILQNGFEATKINLAGYMHFWDLTIDTVTTIIMVLAIGLTVDYSAHIGHGFMAARKGNRNERMQQALEEISPAVFHGGFSTLLAFILLSASDSYVFQTFFKVFFLTVAFGMFHGLFFLPVVLSLIGPKPYAVHHEDGPADNNIDSSERINKISNGNGVQLEKMKTNGNTFVKGASDNPTYVVNN